jgi:hypothetical protein
MNTKIKSKYARGSKKYQDVTSGNVDREIAQAPKNIPGWGIDFDPENDPTYPMKTVNGSDHDRIHYARPTQQALSVDVFQSIERPSLTAVYGTSVPPSGVSGRIRKFAYGFSEADARHWLTLLFADRVNVVEGIIDDLKRGIIPNIFKERGWTAEWKYNRVGFIRNIAVGVAVATAVTAFMIYRRRNRAMGNKQYAMGNKQYAMGNK